MSEAKEMEEARKVDWNARVALAAIVIVGLILVPLDYLPERALPLFLALMAFCVGGGLFTWALFYNLKVRLRRQKDSLLTEFAVERDIWRKKEIEMEKMACAISRAIGMLQADKRSGDKAIGQARELLEGVVRSFILPLSRKRTPDEDSIWREMIQRLEAVNCPADVLHDIVEGAMEHASRASCAAGKLQIWAKVLRADAVPGNQQENNAGYCERAATVKLPEA